MTFYVLQRPIFFHEAAHSKKVGFVVFSSPRSATLAINEMNGEMLMGHNLSVSLGICVKLSLYLFALRNSGA